MPVPKDPNAASSPETNGGSGALKDQASSNNKKGGKKKVGKCRDVLMVISAAAGNEGKVSVVGAAESVAQRRQQRQRQYIFEENVLSGDSNFAFFPPADGAWGGRELFMGNDGGKWGRG